MEWEVQSKFISIFRELKWLLKGAQCKQSVKCNVDINTHTHMLQSVYIINAEKNKGDNKNLTPWQKITDGFTTVFPWFIH